MRTRYLIPAAICLMLATACQTVYIPNTPNVPLMSQGDETQVALGVGSNGYGLNLAYSPYYHWALFGSGSTYAIAQDSNFNVKYRHRYGEIGTGYYTRLNKFWRLEVLAGAGQGATGLPSDRSRYRKIFVQPSVGISGPFVDAGFTLRAGWLQHFETQTSAGPVDHSASAAFLEPMATFRAGWENIKMQVQSGYSFPLGTAPLPYRNFVVSVGVHITLVKDFERYELSYD